MSVNNQKDNKPSTAVSAIVNLAGFKAEYQKVMKTRKENLNLDNILAYLDIKDKKDEFISNYFAQWKFEEKLEKQSGEIKNFLASFGEAVELTIDQKEKVIIDKFREITFDKKGKQVNIGAGRFNFDSLHYVYANLNISEQLPNKQWIPGTPLKHQTDEVKLSTYDTISKVKYTPANNQSSDKKAS